MLADLEQALGHVAERVGPSIVAVRGRGRGTGMVIAAGRILTNAHNVVGGPVALVSGAGDRMDAEVAGVDLDSDLAVLSVETGEAPVIAWDGEEPPGLGQVVFALGATSAGARVTWGTVSAVGRAFRGPRGRPVRGAVEHTAPLARGSSGGPLVDAQGRLLAVNTHRRGDGFYLAVPAGEALRERVDALGRGEQPSRLRLGLALAPSHVARQLRAAVGLPEREGLLVRAVEEGGPADQGGVRTGDLLVEVAGRAVAALEDVYAVLDEVQPPDTLNLRVVRGADEHDLAVRFEDTSGDGESDGAG